MTDQPALFKLLSWLSPNYPVGAFSYSHGLEQAIEAGHVSNANTLECWIEAVLLYETGRIDGPLFREAYSCADKNDWASLSEIAALGAAFQSTAEFALESKSQGDAFIKATKTAWPAEALDFLGNGTIYPIAVAVACATHSISLADGLTGYFHAFAANLVSAGVRLVPLGQSDGQLTLSALEPIVVAACDYALSCPLTEIGSAAPILDLNSMTHETQYSRLFRS
jgi:urease accessory protein